MRDITVLTSACSSPTILNFLACLHNNGERNIRVVGVDMSDDPSTRHLVDRFYKVPVATAPDYSDIMLDICKKEQVDIYFPNISAEVTQIAKRIDEFHAIGTIPSLSNQRSVNISNNKLHAYQELKAAGIPVPNFYAVHSVADFVEGCKVMGYPEKPVCLKIVDGSGSRGVRILDATRSRYEIFVHEKPNSFFTSYEDMLSILNQAGSDFHEMMLVDYMPGNEYTVDLLADNGTVLYEVGRENVVSLMSIAQDSIVAYDEVAYKVAVDVVKLLKFDGNVGFDFMRNAEGIPVLMDINPRLTATVSVIAAAGVNLPYLRIKQLLGEELPVCEPKYGTRLRRRYHELFTDSEGNLIEYNYR